MSTTIQADPALADALSAAADSFPIADLERMPASGVTDVAASFPDGGGRWVAASFTGDRNGAIAVVVARFLHPDLDADSVVVPHEPD